LGSTWGRLTAIAKDAAGHVVATDEIATGGHPDALKITTDRTTLLANGKSLAYLTVHVEDAHGVQVPDAENPIHVTTTGAGTLRARTTARRTTPRATSPPPTTRSTG